MEAFNRLRHRPAANGFAQFTHQHLVVVKIVNGVELCTENFADAVQMVQVGTRELRQVYLATLVERTWIVLVLCVLDLDVAVAGEQVTFARVARRITQSNM